MAPLRVTFLGPLASFSHQAAVEAFGPSAELSPRPSFGDAAGAVQQGEADYAIIPFENSTNGSVVQTLDLLADRASLYKDLRVCGEHYLSVHHCLLARKNASSGQSDFGWIKKLYTHPQAWGQCDTFLGKHFKGVERQDVSSTSKAAEVVLAATTEQSAAIASRFAAEYHGLDVLAENIEDKADNMTRFLVLRNSQSESTSQTHFEQVKAVSTHGQSGPLANQRKTLISFMVNQDLPGALADALSIFKAHGVNLTSINTRPSQKQAWQYIFFIECERIPTTENQDAVARILNDLPGVTENCRDLGTWKNQLPYN